MTTDAARALRPDGERVADEPVSDLVAPATGVTPRAGPVAYAYAYLTIVLVVATHVVLYRLAGDRWGVGGWAEYSLVRRILSFVEPFILLGFSLAVARQVALCRETASGRQPVKYLVAAMLLVAGFTLPCLGVANLLPGPAAALLLGTVELAPYIGPMSLALAGSMLNAIVYSYLQGRLRIYSANSLLLINRCALPLVAFFIFGVEAASMFWWLGALNLMACALALAPIVAPVVTQRAWRGHPLREHSRSLLQYGMRRLPCDLGIVVLLNVPTYAAAHAAGVLEAGTIAFGTTLLSLAGTAVAPIAFFLLPQASVLLQRGDLATLARHARRLGLVFLVVGGAGVVLGEVFLEQGLALYLGEAFLPAAPVLRVMVLGALPYLIYCGFRGLIDAASHRAINARNTWIGIAVGCVCLTALWLLDSGILSILVSLVIALSVLALLTLRDVYQFVTGRRASELEP